MNLGSSTKPIGIGLALLIAFSLPMFCQETLTLEFRDMEPHLGQRLELRIVNTSTRAEVDRFIIDEIPAAAFELDFEVLKEGESYTIDLYADHNANGRYDAPPTDHAWRLEIPAVVGDVVIPFTHTAEFVDIAWPPPIDGSIAPEEYRHVLLEPQTGIEIHWQNDAALLHLGLISPGTGWVAIGFDPDRRMQGADIIIGAVSDGVLTIEDHYGTGQIAHREDSSSRIIQSAGSEANGKTIIEFVVSLAAMDEEDKPLESASEITIILAYHTTSDRLSSRHSERSTTSIALD